MQTLLGKNMYFTCCMFAFLGGLATYLYFYSKEAVSSSVLETSLETSADENKEITVDISGAIDRPGVFTLSTGSRLADLIVTAGGVTAEVSQKWLSRNLNLASVLKDQQKVYVPFEWEVISSFPEYELKELALESAPPANSGALESVGGTGTSNGNSEANSSSGEIGGTSGVLINLNTATKSELESLPKVGEVTAGKIIDFRPYAGMDDLKEKAGITNSVIEAIKNLVTF